MLRILQRIGLQKSYLGPSSKFLPVCVTRLKNYSTNCQIQTPAMMQSGVVTKPQPAFPLDLASGMPPPEIIEASARFLNKAHENLFKHTSCLEVLDYGPNAGPQSTLEQLAYFLSRRYRTGIQSDNIFTMAGASQALSLLPSLLGPKPGRRVFMEQPSYMHAIDILSTDMMYDVVSVETDKYGICPDAFRTAVEKSLTPDVVAESISLNRFASILYIQTAFANPGGWSLPRERLVELERIAEKFNILIIADDVYSFTNFSELTDMSQMTLNSLPYLPSTCTDSGDPSHHVATLGSVSKIISPGLRFGWIVASKRILQVVNDSGFIKSSGCTNQYVASLVGEMIADGSADFLTDMGRKELKTRFDMAHRIFSAHLPSCLPFTMPRGGFFVWIKVPKSLVSSETTSAAMVNYLRQTHGVRVVDGSRCLLSQKNEPYLGLRVSITVLPQAELPQALRALAEGISDYLGFKPTV